MIPTTKGGAAVTRGRSATLIPQGRRSLGGSQGEQILGRLGAARQAERGLHLPVFLPLAAHFRGTTEDVPRDFVAQILAADVAGTPDDTSRPTATPRRQPPSD